MQKRGKSVAGAAVTSLVIATVFVVYIAVSAAPRGTMAVNDFVYQLHDLDLASLGNTKFDLAVIDYSQDGSDELRFTSGQIASLRDGPGGHKLVLAYVSIGEAESYRWYWEDSWDADGDGVPDTEAPPWLGHVNPDWPGNYKVGYWENDWQSIIYGSPTSYVDRVIGAGFDGVYLDIIDAYEYWGLGGESGVDRATAELEMVDLVKGIASYARAIRPDFLVVPQNGEALSSHPDYVQVVSGIGREDTWYDGDTPESPAHTDQVLSNLDVFKNSGKLVLVVDYVTQQAFIDDFYSKATARGYVPYASVRALDRITVNSGHEPD